jgi:hypothetical protein
MSPENLDVCGSSQTFEEHREVATVSRFGALRSVAQ